MGWDLYLQIDTGGPTLADIENASWNYTYNTTPMLKAAGIDLHNFEGRACKEVIPDLKAGLDNLKSNPIKYTKMNPPNGWGSYDGLIKVLENMLITFKKHPKAIVGAWF